MTQLNDRLLGVYAIPPHRFGRHLSPIPTEADTCCRTCCRSMDLGGPTKQVREQVSFTP